MAKSRTHTTRILPTWFYKCLLLGAAAIWGLGTCVIKDAVSTFPAAWLMGLRFFCAGLVLLVACWRRVRMHLSRDTIAAGIIIGLALGPAYLCNTVGLTGTTASKSAFLTSTYVVMVPFIAWAVSRQKPTRLNLVAAALAVLGIAFVSFSGSEGVQVAFGFGEAFTLLSAFLLGLHLAISAKLSQGRDVLTLTAVQFIAGGVIGMAAGFASSGVPPMDQLAQPDMLLNFLYLVLFASCLALTLQNIGIKHVAAAPAALYLSMESVFGVAFAVLLFGDALTPLMLVGFACIAAGIVINETLPIKRELDK